MGIACFSKILLMWQKKHSEKIHYLGNSKILFSCWIKSSFIYHLKKRPFFFLTRFIILENVVGIHRFSNILFSCGKFVNWREVEAGLMEYKPDIIISVHPMMQHIPLWVLKWQGLEKKVIFVTVITDLNTCHRTW